MIVEISICTFNDDRFDVMFKDKESGEEIVFSGTQKLGQDQFELANKIAPSCVWTDFVRVQKD